LHSKSNRVESPPELKKAVGLLQVVAYGIGNIIGAGIYVLVGDASGLAGNAVWLSFLVGAIVALFTGLTYAELASMYPKAASEYVYLGKAYGKRILAFLTEWVMLITEIVAATAVSIGFAGYLSNASGLPVLPMAALLLVALSVVALFGVKASLGLNTVLSIVAIGGLILVVLAGIGKLGSVSYSYSPNGITGILAASSLVFFAYIGFDNMANLSEETKRPEKTVPRGLLIAVAISTVLYLAVGLTAVGLVGWQQLSTSDAPLALAASVTLGPPAYDILTVTALLTTLNTVLVLLVVSSRIIYGMSRESALPKVFGRLNGKTRTPFVASIVVLLLSLALLPLGNVAAVAKITSFGSLLTFALVNLALLHLRRVAPHIPRPFRAPLSIGWVSVTALLGLFSCLFLLTQFDFASIALGLVLPASGMVVYVIVGRRMSPRAGVSIHEQHEI
jgi:basic amino acid/polyamine antiporter, APA family